MTSRFLTLTAAVTLTGALAGCSTAATSSPSEKAMQPSGTAASTPSPTPSELGRPLDQIDKDRPTNSTKAEGASMKRLENEGGLCTLKGTKADCKQVPPAYRADAQALWGRTVLFFPPQVRAKMTDFALLPRGEGGGVAEDDQGKYLFSAGFPETGDVDHIIIHELGHGFEVTTQKAFAAKWYAKFWSKADIKTSQTYDPVPGALEKNPIYAKAPQHFVHPYAATNSSEDFAETFRWFVLGVKPTGTSVKEQKILEMWTVPELVATRERIQKARAEHPGPLKPAKVVPGTS